MDLQPRVKRRLDELPTREYRLFWSGGNRKRSLGGYVVLTLAPFNKYLNLWRAGGLRRECCFNSYTIEMIIIHNIYQIPGFVVGCGSSEGMLF